MFYESHLHFCPDLCIKLTEIYTSQSHVTSSQMALCLSDLLDANGSFPVVTRNWKSIGDKKIYGTNDLPEQGHKEHRVSKGTEGGSHLLITRYLRPSGPAAATVPAGSPNPKAVAHARLTRAWILQASTGSESSVSRSGGHPPPPKVLPTSTLIYTQWR